MVKYYTRACNFYYGKQAKNLINKGQALPLCGNKKLAFDSLELFSRQNGITKNKIIKLREIKKLNNKEKRTVKKHIKKITSKRKNFLKFVNFSSPSIMGILNLTPDSFSDGGKFNKKKDSINHIRSFKNTF